MDCGLQQQIGKRVPPTHPVLSWLIEHVAATISRRSKGSDGMTPHQQVRGRPFSTRMVEFGEFMRYKFNAKSIQYHSTLDSRLGFGIFVGIYKTSGQYMLHDEENIVWARTVTRVPDGRKWQTDKVEAIQCLPWQLATKRAPEIIFREDVQQTQQET